jgi:amino acid permease
VSQKDEADDIKTDTLFYTITIAFLLLSFTVAMIVDDLGVVLAMVGATGSTLVSYVLPGLIYVKIHPEMDLYKIGAYVQIYVGCMIIPIALYFVLSGRDKE